MAVLNVIQIVLALVGIVTASVTKPSIPVSEPVSNNVTDVRKIELYDGVFVKLPEYNNDTRKVMSLEIDTNKDSETGKLLFCIFILYFFLTYFFCTICNLHKVRQ